MAAMLQLSLLLSIFCYLIHGYSDLKIDVGQSQIPSALRDHDLYPVEIEASILHAVLDSAFDSIRVLPATQQSPSVYENANSGWSWQITILVDQTLTYKDLNDIVQATIAAAPPSTAGLTRTFVGTIQRGPAPVADVVILPSKEAPIPHPAPEIPKPISPASPEVPITVETIESREIVKQEEVPQQDPSLKDFLNAFYAPRTGPSIVMLNPDDVDGISVLRRAKRADPETVNSILNDELNLEIPATGLALKLHFWRDQNPNTEKYIVRKTKVKFILNAIKSALNRIPSQVENNRARGDKAPDLLGNISSGVSESSTEADVIVAAWIDRNIDGSPGPPSKLTRGLWVKILEFWIGWYSKLDPEGAALAMEGDIVNTAQRRPAAFGKIRMVCVTEGEL